MLQPKYKILLRYPQPFGPFHSLNRMKAIELPRDEAKFKSNETLLLVRVSKLNDQSVDLMHEL